MFARIPREPLYKRIVDDVMRSVLSGEVRVGDRLPTEPEMVEKLGVSRTVVREAMKALCSAGLVAVSPKRGAYVTQPPIETVVNSLQLLFVSNHQSLDDLITVRRLLEVQVAADAAERARPENLKALLSHLQGMERSLNDHRAFMEYDTAFHSELARATQNAVLSIVAQSVLGMLIRPLFMMLEASRSSSEILPDMPQRALKFHRRIYQAVVDKDSAAAKKGMAEHLEEVEENIARAHKEGALAGWELHRPGQVA